MDEPKRKPKVFWTEDEKRNLCAEAAALIFGLHASRKLDALAKAQDNVLPAERRRRLLALTGMDWFSQGVDAELEALRQAASRPAEPPPPLHPAPESLTLAQMYPLLRARLVSGLADFITDVLKEVKWPEQVTGSGAAEKVGGALIRSLTAPDRAGAAGAPPNATPRRLSSVLVVGLKGGQVEEIRREFDTVLDVRFFGSDENKDKLRTMCERVDHSVALTGFISHAHEEILSRRAKQYIRCAGGITRLKATLRQLVSGPVAEAA